MTHGFSATIGSGDWDDSKLYDSVNDGDWDGGSSSDKQYDDINSWDGARSGG